MLLPVAILAGAATSACGSDGGEATDSTTEDTTPLPSVTSTSASPVDGGSADGPSGTAGGAPDSTLVVPSTAAATPTTAAATAGLVLLTDGFDVVTFGTPAAATVDAVSAVIGPPTSVSEPFQDSPTTFRGSASWNGLDLTFSGPSEEVAFSGYEFGRRFGTTASGTPDEGAPWTPNEWQAVTATADALRPGSPSGDLLSGYPTLYALDCGRPLVPVGLAGGAGTPGQQLFLAPQEQGLFVRLSGDGTIFSIGAQAAPNPLICDGAE